MPRRAADNPQLATYITGTYDTSSPGGSRYSDLAAVHFDVKFDDTEPDRVYPEEIRQAILTEPRKVEGSEESEGPEDVSGSVEESEPVVEVVEEPVITLDVIEDEAPSDPSQPSILRDDEESEESEGPEATTSEPLPTGWKTLKVAEVRELAEARGIRPTQPKAKLIVELEHWEEAQD